jgi:hypothetical protein
MNPDIKRQAKLHRVNLFNYMATVEVLEMTGGNRTKAAGILYITVRGIRLRLSRYRRAGLPIPWEN